MPRAPAFIPLLARPSWCRHRPFQSPLSSTPPNMPPRACTQPTPRPKSRSANMRRRETIDTLQLGPYRIHGVSVAATETCIWVPSLSLAFDAGKCPSDVVPMRYMAITHGHCDHVHGLPLHLATRSMQSMPSPTYFSPPQICDAVRQLVSAVAALERAEMNAHIVPLSPGEDAFELKRGWYLKSFATCHTVPSQGYIVYQSRKKLKDEFVSKSSEEIKALKAAGVQVVQEVLVPEIAFTGDTTLDAIERCEDCTLAKVLITEITFLGKERSIADAREFGHVHFDEVVQKKHLFARNEHVVFTHFSARYSGECILQAMQTLPDELRRKCHALGAHRPDSIDS